MLFLSKKVEKNTLNDEIDSVLDSMSSCAADTEEYMAMANNLETLYKAKAMDKSNPMKVSMLQAGTNILGILLVINYEKIGVVTSKAFSLISKARI